MALTAQSRSLRISFSPGNSLCIDTRFSLGYRIQSSVIHLYRFSFCVVVLLPSTHTFLTLSSPPFFFSSSAPPTTRTSNPVPTRVHPTRFGSPSSRFPHSPPPVTRSPLKERVVPSDILSGLLCRVSSSLSNTVHCSFVIALAFKLSSHSAIHPPFNSSSSSHHTAQRLVFNRYHPSYLYPRFTSLLPLTVVF